MLLQLSRYQKDIRNNIHPIKSFNYWGMHISAKINTKICTILIKLINFLIKTVYFLCDEKKKLFEIGVYHLSTDIMKKLNEYYPNLIIIKSKKIFNMNCDIYIPELKLGFLFRVARGTDNKIKQNILNKIKTCSDNNINLFVFDVDANGRFTKKKMLMLTYEIYARIEKQTYLNNCFLMKNFNQQI